MAILEVDPSSFFVHWEAPEAALASARRRVGDPDGRIVLRSEDASQTGPGGKPFDLELEAPSGKRLFSPGAPFPIFRSTLGVRGRDGAFATLARSNLAQTPPSGESDRYEERYRPVRASAASPWPPRKAAGGGEPARAGAVLPPPGPREGAPVLSPPGPREGAGAVDLMVGAPRGSRDHSFPSAPWPPGGANGEGSRPHEPVLRAAVAPAAVEGLPWIGECPPPGPIAPGLFIEEVASVASGPSTGPGSTTLGSSPFSAFGGQEGLSSRGAGGPVEERVDLELRAEVVIYGRTRPGTAVYVSGAKVPVRADGTFETRFALPPAASGDSGAGPCGGK